jgi:hypothetical protein
LSIRLSLAETKNEARLSWSLKVYTGRLGAAAMQCFFRYKPPLCQENGEVAVENFRCLVHSCEGRSKQIATTLHAIHCISGLQSLVSKNSPDKLNIHLTFFKRCRKYLAGDASHGLPLQSSNSHQRSLTMIARHSQSQVSNARAPFLTPSVLLVVALALPVTASAATKDIVLDRINPVSVGVAAAPARAVAASDALAISVLVESPDGSLTPRSTDVLFRTGERLRVKVLASRSGKVSIHNTNPRGVTSLVWTGDVLVGQETISPRMVLTGHSGEDRLHVVLEPSQVPQGVGSWLSNWLEGFKSGGSASKDIRLDTQSTTQATYVLNPTGQGIVSTLRVVHTR